MPVVVVGADTEFGRAAVDALLPRVGELRAFVTDPDEGEQMRARGVKVAVGDVSDGSHVGGASINAFCAVLAGEAASDGRERSFAATPAAVLAAWADGLADAGVQRVIWLDDESIEGSYDLLRAAAPAVFTVAVAGRSAADVAADVVRIEAERTPS